ncbi:MAG TPA: hypothetical protein VMD53_11215 [Rhizomicrobium sp.]|nr:hypothetical protein [Rhizomicrobium sp.]
MFFLIKAQGKRSATSVACLIALLRIFDRRFARRRDAMVYWADKPILVIGTHLAAPTAGRIKKDGVGFRFDV